jgi:hypothetical protein
MLSTVLFEQPNYRLERENIAKKQKLCLQAMQF